MVTTAAMAVHLPRILEALGATSVQAIAAAAGALIGPAQVTAARIVEAGVLKRYHPLLSARLACITHPLGAALIAIATGSLAFNVFALLHGAGNGILTIARGTLPLAIFGPRNSAIASGCSARRRGFPRRWRRCCSIPDRLSRRPSAPGFLCPQPRRAGRAVLCQTAEPLVQRFQNSNHITT